MLRKYYSARTAKRFAANSQLEGNLHWVLLESLIRGYGTENLGEDFYIAALDSTLKRDVASYLKLASFLRVPQSCKPVREEVLRFRSQYQVICFLKKYPFTSIEYPLDRKEVAKTTLLRCEEKCRLTNERIRTERSPSWVLRARSILWDVLGELQPSLVMKMISSGKHGPGSTLSNSGGKVTPYYKYMDLPYTVTKRCYKYALAAISSNPRWMNILEDSGRRKEIPPFGCPLYQKELMLFQECVEIVDSDRITFVPKDARTDRPIAVGASLNVFCQLGVKSYLEERLKRVGVDLTKQEKNQELAKAGSQFFFENPSQFSTIDLASASDSISTELVKLLLPSDWYAFLDDLRHETGEIDGQIISYEKFCAMGNGFTFPLESLLFYAIARAVAEDSGYHFRRSDFSVYGDDIIVRFYLVDNLLKALDWAGFEVNSEKSYFSGPFKESCGKDYLYGNDVRPFFLKREVLEYADLYFVCNSIARLCMARHRDAGLFALFCSALNKVPRASRIYLPLEDNSDLGLCVPFSTLAGLGIRPFLSVSEKSSLLHSGLLDPNEITNLPYTWRPTIKARPYSGRSSTRLMLWFLGKEERQVPRPPWDKKLEASVGFVTRRNSILKTISVRPVPSWDGFYATDSIARHPFWDATL
nr:MAG: hypothetical protein 3 [Leviviridae sp.]